MLQPHHPVYPITEENADRGLTYREWLAGQALAGLMANSDLVNLMKSGFAPTKGAEICWAMADAMIFMERQTLGDDVHRPKKS